MDTNARPPLAGRHILVASGPTRAPIDAVRYIGNRSTGRLGSTIATELLRRGTEVTFMYGTGSVTPEFSSGLRLDEIETIDEAWKRLNYHLKNQRIFAVIMAMAVLDYRPKETTRQKLPSEREEMTLTLVKCPKLIERIKAVSPDIFLVGFKLEAGISEGDLFGRAEDLARRARCDLVVANRIDDIRPDKHVAWFVGLGETGREITGPYETPQEIAQALADRLAAL